MGHLSKLISPIGLRRSFLSAGQNNYKVVRMASFKIVEEPWEKEIYTTAPIDKVSLFLSHLILPFSDDIVVLK
jgi:hypothetical protein